MLNKIKSSFFSKILFAHIDYKNLLKLFKYNKDFQNIYDLKITDYKIFSGRYITYEANGKAKEYDAYKDILIYEGDYLNGKRNGKGKEYYDDGSIKFRGEYLNGKRHGKGKEYIDNELIFKGEYLNGKKWNGEGNKNYYYGSDKYKIKEGKGYVFEFYKNGYIKFKGEYLNGEKNGKGKEYNEYNELIFEGEYLNGKRWNGKGFDLYNDNEESNIIKEGAGYFIEYCSNLKYIFKLFEGQYLNGERNGTGKEYNPDVTHGTNCDNLIYEGEYLNGKKQGKGKEYYMYDGPLFFEGEFSNNHKRKGKTYYRNGALEFEGEYIFDKKWDGIGYDKKGNKIYKLINGNGTVREYDYINQLLYEGEYLNGKRNGKGKEYKLDYDDEIIELKFIGEYLNGKKWNGKGYHLKKVSYELKEGKGMVKEFKEYYDGQQFLHFEGEYSNGERKGKGKEYDYNGNSYLKEKENI